ncbi:DUF7289 family protein [Halobellus captivus]|uniref:DUF7289 family protein n=1 Tax=Halobellus captivus TaxID=2592614 RepID=UPI0011A57475|nr:hypothetical protein [Halobellus captivus]
MTDRAQASNIGLVLLLALTITGAGVVVALGSTALTDVQDSTSIDRAEHAMTLLDARAAVVGLGEGSVQTVRLGDSSGGTYAAESESGWLRIRHENYTAGETEDIYNASLGSVSYRTDETTVAYQGGGVWRQEGGGTSMVSPPEFHYRGTTLTLPVLRVRSTDTASGDTRATVRRSGELTRIYPNEAATDTDGVGAPYDVEAEDGSIRQYVNPVTNGTVDVTVHSAYYEGWADYFRTRTTGNVSVDHDNRTATVVLETANEVGAFAYPEKGESIPVRGIDDGHSVTDFQTSIKKDGGTFNNIFVSFYVEDGDKAYEAAVEVPNGIGNNYCNGGEPGSETLTMDIYYDDASTPEGVHRWTNDSIPSDSGAVQLDCEDGDTVIDIDFTSTEQEFTYGSSSLDDTAIDWDERDADAAGDPNPTTFAHTGDDGEDTTYSYGDAQNLRILTRHYFAMFDSEFDLTVYHGPGNRGTSQISNSESGGTLRYDTIAGESYITYLHVTENNVTVELD